MSRPIDEKLVVMKMDNADIKRKATETVSIFGKLKSAFTGLGDTKLDQVDKQLKNISTSADQVNLSTMANALSTISSRFSTLGVVATTALANITNRAVDAGLALGRSLTLDQVTSGFQEYETKIGAIGTVLSNTEWAGTTLEDVKRVLEELNVYADNTVYSFSQMTENIGRFTAAGVGIEDSAIAIKGLSNLAAASGSDVNQLNTAMYQMSQAMAAGTMNLMDWNSLVNAGMAGKKTQDALLATAKSMGIVVDTTDGFRNSIQDGWLTSEVFLETMKKFGQDQSMTEAATAVRTFSGLMDSLKESIGSGWATTFEHIFGDFEEATVFWTEMSEKVTGFFSKSSESRNKLVKDIADGGGFLDFFKGTENVLQPLFQTIGAIGDGFKKAFPPASAATIVDLMEKFKNFTAGLALNSETMDKLTTIGHGFFSVFSTIIEVAKSLGGALLNMIPPGVGGSLLDILVKLAEFAIGINESVKEGNLLTKTIDNIGLFLSGFVSAIASAGSAIIGFTGNITEGLGGAIEWVLELLRPIGEAFKEAFGDFGGDDVVGAGSIAALVGLLVMVSNKLSGITGVFDDFLEKFDGVGDLIEGFQDTLSGVSDSLQAFTAGIKIANLVMIAGAMTMIAVSLKMLEGIKTEDITKGIVALGTSLAIMMGAMIVIGKFNLVGGLGASATLIAMATAVTIMAGALRKLSDVDPDNMKVGLAGLVGIVTVLTASIVALSKLGGKVAVGSIQLIALATSVKILASALEDMSSIKSGDLKKSLIAMTAIFAQLALFLAAVKSSKISVSSALGLVAVAGAVSIMVSAIKDISDISKDDVIKGLITVAAILAQIAIFSTVAGGPGMLLAGAGMLMIAGAINALVPPIQSLGNMSLEELAKGLGALAIALAAVAGAGILASGSIGGAIAITIMAGAMNMLLIPIKTFANMSWGTLLKGMAGLGLTLGVVAGAAMLLSPAIVPMLGFGAAVTLIGAAVLLAGAGLTLFATGLGALATVLVGSVSAIVAGIALLIKELAKLIPAAVKFVADLAIALLNAIGSLVDPLVNAIGDLIIGLLKGIQKYLPPFIEIGVDIVVKLIEGIVKHGPELIDAGVKAIVDLINALANTVGEYGPELTAAILNLLGEMILLFVEAGTQTINALFGWIPGVQEATATIGKTAEDYIRKNFGAAEVAKEKSVEFAQGLQKGSGDAKVAGSILGSSAKQGVESINLFSIGQQAGSQFANGLASKREEVFRSSNLLGNTASGALRSSLQTRSPSKVTTSIGKDTGQGFANGIKSKSSAVKKSATDLAKDARDAFNSRMSAQDEKYDLGLISYNDYLYNIKKITAEYSKYKDITILGNRKIAEVESNLRKEQLDKSKAWIDEEKYYKRLSLEDELRAWERIQARYKEGTEERKEAERELYRIKNELQNDSYDNSTKWIDNEQYYNRMSLTEELKAWERVQKRYKEGTEERKQADREVYRVKNEINNRLKELNDEYINHTKEANQQLIADIKAVNDEYENEVKNLTNSLTNFMGIFDEVAEPKEGISGEKLLDNLKGQVEQFTSWSQNITLLQAKGVDEDLLKTLRELGPSAAQEIAALTTLTDAQLKDYSNVWKTKNALAKHEALIQLEDHRKKADETIEGMKKTTEEQLDEYKEQWLEAIREINEGVTDEYVDLNTSMEEIGHETIKNLVEGMKGATPELQSYIRSMTRDVTEAMSSMFGITVPATNSIVGILDKLKQTSPIKAINEFLEGVVTPSGDNEIHFKAVVDYSELDNLNGSDISPSQPDTSITTRAINIINAARVKRQTTSDNTSTNNNDKEPNGGAIDRLLNVVQELLDKPSVTQLNVDGQKMAEVVSGHQYNSTAVSALTKGVTL